MRADILPSLPSVIWYQPRVESGLRPQPLEMQGETTPHSAAFRELVQLDIRYIGLRAQSISAKATEDQPAGRA